MEEIPLCRETAGYLKALFILKHLPQESDMLNKLITTHLVQTFIREMEKDRRGQVDPGSRSSASQFQVVLSPLHPNLFEVFCIKV